MSLLLLLKTKLIAITGIGTRTVVTAHHHDTIPVDGGRMTYGTGKRATIQADARQTIQSRATPITKAED
jgi:hypothetical protein